MLGSLINFITGFGLTSLLALSLILLYRGHLTKPRQPTKKEKYFYTSESDLYNDKKRITSITKPCELTLTVVVPAYNETERLPVMIDDAAKYLKKTQQLDSTFKYEIIIVDDGSQDKTSETAIISASQHQIEEHLKVIKLEYNRGKGGAVTQGVLAARGKYILFADADGATRFSDIQHLCKKMDQVIDQGYGVVVGSRAHLVGTDAVVKRTALRNFLMYGFHTYLSILGIRGIGDTQCGFKLFSRKSAYMIFANLRTERWIFDIEALLLAKLFKMPIAEVNVNWHEVAGSKINIIRDAIKMALDLLMIRLCYFVGVWKVTNPYQIKQN